MKPRLLDLFCCAGGATRGYQLAGFHVTGVDIRPQPRYCGDVFHQADALTFPLDGFDVIHASPPCQAHTALNTMPNAKQHPDLIPATRKRLTNWGGLWVIENVPGAPLINPLLLCGTMFGLRTADGKAELWRHRGFESSAVLWSPGCCMHRESSAVIGIYGGHGRDRRRVVTVTGHAGGSSKRDGTRQFSTQARSEAMGIDWMTGTELSQAIPPAYTEWIGRRILEAL